MLPDTFVSEHRDLFFFAGYAEITVLAGSREAGHREVVVRTIVRRTGDHDPVEPIDGYAFRKVVGKGNDMSGASLRDVIRSRPLARPALPGCLTALVHLPPLFGQCADPCESRGGLHLGADDGAVGGGGSVVSSGRAQSPAVGGNGRCRPMSC